MNLDANEFIQTMNSDKQNPVFKLAIVTSLFTDNSAKLKFDGETEPSEKKYPYLSTYSPAANDRVLLVSLAGTYVILGKIKFL
jgi:hypothetical protein